MSGWVPRDWIGVPLRSAYAPTAEAPLPEAIDALLARIDSRLALRTFGHDLTALIPGLRSYARSLTGNGDAADDLVQDTLLRAWKARDQFTAGTSLRAWTSTILRNAFLNQRRHARFDAEYDEQVAELRLAHPEAQSAVVELEDVRRAMNDLVPDQREALRLVSIEGLSYEEAAHRLGVSLGSFKSRVSRGRRVLQSVINGDAPRAPSAAAPNRSTAPPLSGRRLGHHRTWSAAKAAGQPFWIG